MKELKTIAEIRAAVNGCHSIVSQDTGIMMQTGLYIAEQMTEMNKSLKKLRRVRLKPWWQFW